MVTTRASEAADAASSRFAEVKMRQYTFSRSSFSENQAVSSDLLVEALDAFAVPALRFTAMGPGMFRENHLGLAPTCGTIVAL